MDLREMKVIPTVSSMISKKFGLRERVWEKEESEEMERIHRQLTFHEEYSKTDGKHSQRYLEM